MSTVTMFSIEEVISAIESQAPSRKISLGDMSIQISSTIRTILNHGTTCSCCGEEALYFMLCEPQHENDSHYFLRLMFDHTDDTGKYAYMTKDHIIPRSKGGSNHYANYQPMCNICNATKRDNVSEADYKRGRSIHKHLFTPKNWEVLYYIAHIRLITIIHHKNATLVQFNHGVKSIIRRRLINSIPDWKEHMFDAAYRHLIQEVMLHPAYQKGASNKPRPATIFREQNNDR